MKTYNNQIPVGFHLDNLAAYLDGEVELKAFSQEEQLFLQAVENGICELRAESYTLSRTLHISSKLALHGNGAVITGSLPPASGPYIGAAQSSGIYITASNVSISDLTLQEFTCAVDLDSAGRTAENIFLENITVLLKKVAFQFGSSYSEGILRNVCFRGCNVICQPSNWETNELSATLPFTGGAAFARSECDAVNNCLLEDIWFENNKISGQVRIGFNLVGSATTMEMIASHKGHFSKMTMRGLHFINNTVEQCWDVPLSIVAACHNTTDGLAENIEIIGNRFGHGIAGMYLFAAEPLNGKSENAILRNVSIHDNQITRVIPDVGEPSRSLFIGAARQDYYEGLTIKNALLEKIDISGNTMDGAGPSIVSVYAMLDGKTLCSHNITRDIRIHNNIIQNADYAFMFRAVELEGRRYDWNFGYPRHDMEWLPPIEDDNIPLVTVSDNRIEGLCCENNEIDGYRYRVLAAGADCRGHGFATGNRIYDGIIFRNNTFRTGEGHLRVAGFIGEDYCVDNGKNLVASCFMDRQLQ